jgi:chaperone required for assembly of F1-ATPase
MLTRVVRVMIPSLELAQIIAAEWEKQHEIIDLGRMPMVRISREL